jgi:hypothetical protein
MKKQLLGGSETKFFQQVFENSINIRYIGDSIVYHHLTQEKQNRRYWIRQAFDGGRSLVRMKRWSLSSRLKTVIESGALIPFHLLLCLVRPANAFRHLYCSMAHAGRIKESCFWWQMAKSPQ